MCLRLHVLGRIGIQTGSHVSLDGLLEFLGKTAGLLLWDDKLGKHENGGLEKKNNSGKYENNGSKHIELPFANESCRGSLGETAPFRVFTRRSKTAAKQ